MRLGHVSIDWMWATHLQSTQAGLVVPPVRGHFADQKGADEIIQNLEGDGHLYIYPNPFSRGNYRTRISNCILSH